MCKCDRMYMCVITMSIEAGTRQCAHKWECMHMRNASINAQCLHYHTHAAATTTTYSHVCSTGAIASDGLGGLWLSGTISAGGYGGELRYAREGVAGAAGDVSVTGTIYGVFAQPLVVGGVLFAVENAPYNGYYPNGIVQIGEPLILSSYTNNLTRHCTNR